VTEVMEPGQVEATAVHADLLQVGSRNMQNVALLREVGSCGRPVLLKRGMSATIEEWLLAAEYVMSAGNAGVILCERGIRSFDPAMRFTLDLAAVPAIKHLSHLPVLVDPSHALGHAYAVPAMMLAAAAAGADGILVDVHPDPATALCDGRQALLPREFSAAMTDVTRVLSALGRSLAPRQASGKSG
jgi:3-deoxy-7-phosphoheptulonate synthase